jgi:hypothetical protein
MTRKRREENEKRREEAASSRLENGWRINGNSNRVVMLRVKDRKASGNSSTTR